jgi:Trypsin
MKKLIYSFLLVPTLSLAIDGGIKVKNGEFPAVVKLNNFQNGGLAHCTGSLIAPNILVTAAHCVEKSYYKQQRVSKAGDIKGDIGAFFSKDFKVKNIYYLDDAKLVKSEVQMIRSYINGPHFHLSPFHKQVEVKENLEKLEKKSIEIDLAIVELTENQEISHDQLLKLSCEKLPEGSEVIMVGYGKNQKEGKEKNLNPNSYLEKGKNFYFLDNYVFDSRMGNLLNHGDSGGPLLATNNSQYIYGVASYKTMDAEGKTISGTYTPTSSFWARKLYSSIVLDPKASQELIDLVSECL